MERHMDREISAGGVVLRRMRDRWWIATIEPQPSTAQRASKNKKAQVWALPKGSVDAGEKPEEAALREVLEETGIEATIVTKLTDIKYVYVRTWGNKQRVFKIVSFYLLHYRSGRLGEISQEMRKEVRSTDWVPLEEAPRRLSYPGERDVAKLAVQYVDSHPNLTSKFASAQNSD